MKFLFEILKATWKNILSPQAPVELQLVISLVIKRLFQISLLIIQNEKQIEINLEKIRIV